MRTTSSRNITSLKQFFVLGALVAAMLLATWWVRPTIEDGWGGQSDNSGEIALELVAFSGALVLGARLLSSLKHVVGFECHDISFECCLQLCLLQPHLMMCNFINLFECGAN